MEGRLRDCKRISFVTGAGISQESGIPTFRGEDGLWRRHDPMRLATIEAFEEDPRLVWEWYEDRRRNIRSSSPNPGHAAVAELEKWCKVDVLTQNIDGLHQRAGSTGVLELHGSIIRVRCTTCAYRDEAPGDFASLPPACACGSILRPDVVWFGEALPQNVWGEAIKRAGKCDLMVVAGTSLVVSPANTLPAYAKRAGAVLVEVNPEETAMSYEMDASIRDTSSHVLPRLADMIRSLKESG